MIRSEQYIDSYLCIFTHKLTFRHSCINFEYTPNNVTTQYGSSFYECGHQKFCSCDYGGTQSSAEWIYALLLKVEFLLTIQGLRT